MAGESLSADFMRRSIVTSVRGRFQRFVREQFDVTANVCYTHLTGIARKNNKHVKYFQCKATYEAFYSLLCRCFHCTSKAVGEVLLLRLV